MFLNPYRFLSTLGPFDINGYAITEAGSWIYVYDSVLQSDGKIVITGQIADANWDVYNIFFARYNIDGTLDNTFGTNGIEEKPDIQFSEGGSVAMQTDGKIVFSGDDGSHVIVGRLNPDGSFDTGFGTNGYTVVNPSSTNWQQSWEILSLPSNDVIVAYGSYGGASSPYHYGLVKLSSTGSIDTSFGVSGFIDYTITNAPDPSYSTINHRLSLQSDGKILFFVYLDGTNTYRASRYTSSGMIDASFGVSGYITIDVSTTQPYDRQVIGITQLSDSKILLSYTSYSPINTYHITTTRLNSNGTNVDSSYGDNGYVYFIPDSTYTLRIYNLCLQSDDKCILTGHIQRGSTMLSLSVRISQDGTVDYTYGDTGTHYFIPPGFTDSMCITSALKYNTGNIIIPMNIWNNDRDSICIERLNYLGDRFTNINKPTISPITFSVDGYDQTAGWYDPYYDYLLFNDCVEQSDNKVVSIGFATVDSTSVMLARHDSNGTMDTTFGDNGIVFISELTSTSPIINSYGYGVALQTDNKILFCGEYDGEIVVGRLTTSGTLDNSFASVGYAQFLTDVNSYKIANQVEVLSDGKILVSYHTKYSSVSTYIHGIIKLNSDGTIDSTFTNNATFTDTNYLYDGVLKFKVLPDNKILFTIKKANNTIIVKKLNPDGTVDTTFGIAGEIIAASGATLTSSDITVQQDGKFLLLVSGFDNLILRFNPDGSTDTDFATGGAKTLLRRGANWIGKLNKIQLQYDEKILIFSSDDEYYGKGSIFRLFNNGELDFSFGTGGRVDLLPTAPVNITTFYSGLAQADGKIVAVGTSRRGGGGASSIIARFLPNGNLDI